MRTNDDSLFQHLDISTGNGTIQLSASNMDDENVVKRYYPDQQIYKELQRVKMHIDPTNLFSNTSTIRLPINNFNIP